MTSKSITVILIIVFFLSAMNVFGEDYSGKSPFPPFVENNAAADLNIQRMSSLNLPDFKSVSRKELGTGLIVIGSTFSFIGTIVLIHQSSYNDYVAELDVKESNGEISYEEFNAAVKSNRALFASGLTFLVTGLGSLGAGIPLYLIGDEGDQLAFELTSDRPDRLYFGAKISYGKR